MPRAVVLFSGGLDSMLAVRIMQEQGFDVDALNIRTIYDCCQASAAQTAVALGATLTVLSVDDDYVDLIRDPSYGHGKGANPCVDCRTYMCRMAKRFMEDVGACVVATGEIAGQRPMSQKRHQMDLIARRSGLEGRLLRPLSAKLLEPTIPEIEGLIDREKLYAFNGRGRRPLIELAEKLGAVASGFRQQGIQQWPSPSTGCALAERSFAPRVRDLMQWHPGAARWDFELLNYGRHFRFDRRTKIVIGRNAGENASLQLLAAREDAPENVLLAPENFRGPTALIVGVAQEEVAMEAARKFAGALVLRYTREEYHDGAAMRVDHGGTTRVVPVVTVEGARSATTL